MTTEKKNMSKIGFILSAVGAAVGLGNLWGFPTKMMAWGGPAFLVPYIIAILVLGLPFLILEVNLGSKWRKAPVSFYGEYLGRFGKPFAWMQAAIQLLIGTFYAVIIAWVVISLGVSFTDLLGDEGFFGKKILGNVKEFQGDSLYGLGKIQPIVFLAFFGVVCLTGLIASFGINKGIEAANKFMVPFLFLLIFGIFAYSLTLSDAGEGLEIMFKPQFGKLEDLGAWRAAFSQAFFTLSLAVSVIIVYSIHSPKGGDNTNRAITIMAGDTLIALLACVIIGATLGYSQGQGVIEIDGSTVTLASGTKEKVSGSSFVFKMFPQTFKKMSESIEYLGQVVGVAFYLALFFAAMSSMISVLEPAVANFEEGHGISRFKAVILLALFVFVFGVPFTFQGGSGLIDITDIYTGYFLLLSAIITGTMVIISRKKTKELTDANNESSIYKLGTWFRFLIIFSVFLTLAALVLGIYANVASPGGLADYNGFQWGFISFCYFLPFSILVFGFGCSGFWKKLWKKRGK